MGDYAFYIWSAYGAAGIGIGLLVLHTVLDYRAQARKVASLEARGRAGHG
ncbi:heme exporter protein CcmD [Enterovirga sp.]|nr:heme exporter protein CcmD [Enterovirga sp.]HMO31000.1 heme exporter protein CcmD [Enterovirga sp.]